MAWPRRLRLGWTTGAFGIALALQLTVGVLVVRHLGAVEDADRLESRAAAMLRALMDVREALFEAEAAERGFVISGDRQYLDHYLATAKRFERDVARVTALVADEPSRASRFESLRKLLQEKARAMGDVVRMREETGFHTARDQIATLLRSGLMARVHRGLLVFEGDEEARLAKHRASREDATREVRGILVLGGVLVMLLVLGAFLWLQHEAGRRRKGEQALAERERALSALVSEQTAILESPVAGFARLSGGRFVWVNRVFAETLGYTPQDLLGAAPRLVHQTDEEYAVFAAAARRAVRATGSFSGEMRARHRNGSEVWIALGGARVGSSDGDTVWVGTDVTARKRAEAATRDAERFLRALTDVIPDRVGYVDLGLRVVFANAAWSSAVCRPGGDLHGAHLEEVLGADAMETLAIPLAAALEGERQDLELAEEQPGAVARHHLVRLVPDRAGDAVRGLVVLMTDVTALKRAQIELEARNAALSDETLRAEAMRHSLEQQRTLLQAMIDHLPFGVVVYDDQRRLVIRNALFARLLLYPEALLTRPGLRFDDLVAVDVVRGDHPGATLEEVLPRFLEAIDSRTHAHFERRQHDGSFIEIEGVPLPGGWSMLTYTDVSRHKAAAHELEAARLLAETANQAKSIFLATMSHEIRTPMNAIIGTVQVLERTRLDADQRHLVGIIRSAGRGLLGVIDDVLDLSKIEAGHLEVQSETFDLPAVLRQAVSVHDALARAKGLALHLAPLPEPLGTLEGDARRLSQVLNNLLSNAIKFTHQGGVHLTVTLIARAPSQVRLRFSVRDTGIGISSDLLKGLFTAYSQASPSMARDYGGTGLGLAICHQLVHLMGGEIGVSSTPNQGSEFWFELPFAESSPFAQPLPPGAPAVRGELRLEGVRLLVVDDSTVNLDVARRLLGTEGARVEVAVHGEDALARLRASPEAFDLVLMDLQMPIMDGIEAARRMRQEPALRGLPVVAVTAGALPGQLEAAFQAGIRDFISKPYELDTMVAVIRQRLRTHSTPSGQTPGAAEPALNPFPPLPGIDASAASRRFLGDLNLFKSALRSLRKEFEDVVARVRGDLARGEATEAARRLHKLRGAAGNLAANSVATLAGVLEDAAREGVGQVPEVSLEALQQALAEVLSGLGDTTRPAPEAVGPIEADAAALAPERIEVALAALEGHDMEALGLCTTLGPPLARRCGSTAASEFTDAVEALRFEEAADWLRARFETAVSGAA